MDINERITFVVAVNNNEIFESNFLSSPIFHKGECHQILPQQNFRSASKAYNSGIEQSENDLIIFAHQDVFFPESWIADLRIALCYIERKDPKWGVLGCFGVTKDGIGKGYLYCTGNRKILGKTFENPVPVQTLDEIVLIIRKSSGLFFDSTLPNFHLYGTDICMQALSKAKASYAIPAFCLHNSNETVLFPREFYESTNHIRKRWEKYLPIYTSCIKITKSKVAFLIKEKYMRYIKYFYSKIMGRNEHGFRVKEPAEFMKKLETRMKL